LRIAIFNRIRGLHAEKLRFFLVGGWNTAFGFILGIALYYYLIDRVNIVFIGVVSNLISISMSFLTNKIFVFKTKGGWIHEYLKCYIVYGFMAAFSVFMLWFFVDFMCLNIFISQLLILLVSVCISYYGHSRFTYKK